MSKHKYPNLKGLMAQNNITQKDLATIIGVAQQSFSNKVTGRQHFNILEIKEILNYFKKSFEYIFFTPVVANMHHEPCNSITQINEVANM